MGFDLITHGFIHPQFLLAALFIGALFLFLSAKIYLSGNKQVSQTEDSESNVNTF
jgi:hypothetical protein